MLDILSPCYDVKIETFGFWYVWIKVNYLIIELLFVFLELVAE